MLAENYNIRKLVAIFFGFIILVWLVVWLYNYLTSSTIVLSTSNPNNIVKVERVYGENNKHGLFSVQATHTISTRVKPGTYQLSVYDSHGDNGVSKTVTLHARQKEKLTLNPSGLVTATPVYGSEVNAVSADSSRLRLLDAGSGNLLEIGQNQALSNPLAGYHFIETVGGSLFSGMATDQNGSLFMVQDQSLTPFAVPFPVTATFKYSIAANGIVYVTDGRTAYVTVPGGLNKIYTSDEQITQLAAGTDRLALVETGKQKSSEPSGNVVLIDSSGKITKAPEEGASLLWSPDSKNLLMREDAETTVFDSSLHNLKTISINQSGNFTWLNDRALAYSVGSQLWIYDINQNMSTELATLPTGQNITGIYPDMVGSYVYFSADNGEQSQLFKAGLQGQKADESLNALSAFLPESVGVCLLNFINFTSPVITASYTDGTTTPDFCVNAARGELLNYGLDPAKFSIQPVVIPRE